MLMVNPLQVLIPACRLVSFFILLLQGVACYAQSDLVISEPTGKEEGKITAYETGYDHTVYGAMNRIFIANQPVSYITFSPFVMPLEERDIELREGEGKNGYVFEHNMDQCYLLFRGRNQTNHFSQTFRFYIDFNLTQRMTNDESKPLIPSNFKIGFGLDKVIFDNVTGIKNPFSRNSDWVTGEYTVDAPLHFLYLSLLVQHYSNGQPPGFFYDTISERHDYISGDFASNILKSTLTYSILTNKSNLFSFSFGYQQDGGIKNTPFEYAPEQIHNYGYHRLISMMQWRSRPFPMFKSDHVILRSLGLGRFYWEDIEHGKKYHVESMWEARIRMEFEYIIGNLSNYRHDNKRRPGIHLFAELNPLRSRYMGVPFIHFYAGRDYMNIRFDDVIYTIQFGLSYTIDKYYPVGFKSIDAQVKE